MVDVDENLKRVNNRNMVLAVHSIIAHKNRKSLK